MSSTQEKVARGILAGIAGTGVMTAFQKWMEMPLTGRGDSYVPAELAERVLPVNPTSAAGRKRLKLRHPLRSWRDVGHSLRRRSGVGHARPEGCERCLPDCLPR